MKFYHATTPEAMNNIFADGMIKAGWDGYVYLCEDPRDACKFLTIRGINDIQVIEVELDESQVTESYDHNGAFFGCKAYVYEGDIQLRGDEPVTHWKTDR